MEELDMDQVVLEQGLEALDQVVSVQDQVVPAQDQAVLAQDQQASDQVVLVQDQGALDQVVLAQDQVALDQVVLVLDMDLEEKHLGKENLTARHWVELAIDQVVESFPVQEQEVSVEAQALAVRVNTVAEGGSERTTEKK
ncbi:hypothetical protein D9C73_016930 [Collichthys lucidus]|uniref:Uncharacterized protein n=1 Tax=Collichthys lucidus TaxID=240159 RepID=A0A4U5V678_COLLU|nr:hypothetical protein D9C73_016930 [Collichthys lucidus]